MSEFSETSEGVERTLPIESIRVGEKLTITAIPLRRNPNPFSESGGGSAEDFKKEIAEVIEGSDGVIFEYFPEETRRLSSSPFLNLGDSRELYKSVIDYFEPIVELNKKYEKPAYVFDPAYDEKFVALFNELPTIISALGGLTIGPTAIFGFIKGANEILSRVSPEDREPEKKKEPEGKGEQESGGKMSRRQFLVVASGAAALGAVSLATMRYEDETRFEHLTGTPSTSRFPSEVKFRRAIIAKGISQLSENLDNNPSQGVRNLVLLYTPMHWQGLKGLLENRKRLDEEFNLYCSLKKGGLDDAFFTARKYEWTGKEWSLEKAEIGGRPGPTI